jgi:hypothetical protein
VARRCSVVPRVVRLVLTMSRRRRRRRRLRRRRRRPPMALEPGCRQHRPRQPRVPPRGHLVVLVSVSRHRRRGRQQRMRLRVVAREADRACRRHRRRRRLHLRRLIRSGMKGAARVGLFPRQRWPQIHRRILMVPRHRRRSSRLRTSSSARVTSVYVLAGRRRGTSTPSGTGAVTTSMRRWKGRQSRHVKIRSNRRLRDGQTGATRTCSGAGHAIGIGANATTGSGR